uniref:RNase H type-1 domain-containing protein n=1 Tax=viral metagenome TaxID=1070528 RepID=A0A6C0AEV7_9ZZZZ
MSEYILLFDGSCYGNPGPSGSGSVLFQNDIEIWSLSYYIGSENTNNYAEYTGLLKGLKYLNKKGIDDVLIRGDSMLVINQMTGKWQCKSNNLIQLFERCKKYNKDTYKYEYIPREKNKRADQLANIAVDNGKNK